MFLVLTVCFINPASRKLSTRGTGSEPEMFSLLVRQVEFCTRRAIQKWHPFPAV